MRRSLLRGHPWVFRDSVAFFGDAAKAESTHERAQLAKVIDDKGDLGWAIFDPHGPLALRMLSFEKNPPQFGLFEERFARALALRSHLNPEVTNAYRLFNGEGDRLPGLVCDVYGGIAILQFDGQGCNEFWQKDHIAQWLLTNTSCQCIYEKSRRNSERTIDLLAGNESPSEVTILENGVRFKVNLEKGQKTGFFLDQRENRQFVRTISKGKSVLNLFSYTGGFSVYAGLGAATRVASLDVSRGAIDTAEENWLLNDLNPKNHEGLCVDVFEYLRDPGNSWDHILVDPPSMGHSEAQRNLAKEKYIELFAAAAKRVTKGGELSLSSCSSHISFEDFFDITAESLSLARRTGRILRVSGQGPDHPFPHICRELQYLKYFYLVLD